MGKINSVYKSAAQIVAQADITAFSALTYQFHFIKI